MYVCLDAEVVRVVSYDPQTNDFFKHTGPHTTKASETLRTIIMPNPGTWLEVLQLKVCIILIVILGIA